MARILILALWLFGGSLLAGNAPRFDRSQQSEAGFGVPSADAKPRILLEASELQVSGHAEVVENRENNVRSSRRQASRKKLQRPLRKSGKRSLSWYKTLMLLGLGMLGLGIIFVLIGLTSSTGLVIAGYVLIALGGSGIVIGGIRYVGGDHKRWMAF